MKELLLMLFFSKWIVLTPVPVDLTNNWLELTPKKPLKAITGGAGIYIDVTAIVSKYSKREELESLFPFGSIVAKLVDKKGYEFLMVNGSAYSTSEDGIMLMLLNSSPTPTNKKFVKVLLKSDKRIEKVRVIWQNSKL